MCVQACRRACVRACMCGDFAYLDRLDVPGKEGAQVDELAREAELLLRHLARVLKHVQLGAPAHDGDVLKDRLVSTT